MESIILVNKKDRIIGYETKEKCHKGNGILHRAFSILIFNKNGKVLIQKRSKLKKLWPLFWSDTCASHPRKGENHINSGKRRLKEEMGFTCNVNPIGKFFYKINYKKIGSENEICTILIGKYNGKVKPNKKEVADYKWINLDQLKKEVRKSPNKYVPWLKIALKKFFKKK